jgi:hypothetical protein
LLRKGPILESANFSKSGDCTKRSTKLLPEERLSSSLPLCCGESSSSLFVLWDGLGSSSILSCFGVREEQAEVE